MKHKQEYKAKLLDFMHECPAEQTNIDDYINQRASLVVSNYSAKIIAK